MKMDFSVESMQDAVLARAALDGLLKAYQARGAVTDTKVTQETITETVINRLQGESPAKASIPATESGGAAEDSGADDADSSTDTAPTGAFTKDQIKAAAEKNPALAALVKGRGRKSAAQQAEINRLTAETLGVALPQAPTQQSQEPIGAALKGASATELAAALAQNTTVTHQEPGVEVRTVTAGPATQVQQPTAPASSPIAGDSSLAELLAARQRTQQPQVQTQPETTAPVSTGTPAPTPPFLDGATDQAPRKTVEEMSQDELLAAIREYADQGAGLFWFRSVVERSKTGDMTKMSAEYMREVLKNPGAYYPAAV
jgi:hypothetical protein